MSPNMVPLSELQALQKAYVELRAANDKLHAQKSNLEGKVAYHEQEIMDLNKTIHKLSEDNKRLENEASSLELACTRLGTSVTRLEAALQFEKSHNDGAKAFGDAVKVACDDRLTQQKQEIRRLNQDLIAEKDKTKSLWETVDKQEKAIKGREELLKNADSHIEREMEKMRKLISQNNHLEAELKALRAIDPDNIRQEAEISLHKRLREKFLKARDAFHSLCNDLKEYE